MARINNGFRVSTEAWRFDRKSVALEERLSYLQFRESLVDARIIGTSKEKSGNLWLEKQVIYCFLGDRISSGVVVLHLVSQWHHSFLLQCRCHKLRLLLTFRLFRLFTFRLFKLFFTLFQLRLLFTFG